MTLLKILKKKESVKLLNADVFYKKAMEVAIFYGFANLNTIVPPESIWKEKGRDKDAWADLCQQEKMNVMKLYVERLMQGPQPVQFFWRPAGSAASKDHLAHFSMEIIGGGKSISEGLILSVARALLEEVGYRSLSVAVNSVGERESFASFLREVGSYFRKHGSTFCATCRQQFKKDPLVIYSCRVARCREMVDNGARAIASLNEDSRAHFKEVLEYLETMGIPFELDHHLVGSSTQCFKTLFEIRSPSEESETGYRVLARGGRYDSLAKRLGFKREISAVGITLECPISGSASKNISVKHRKSEVYFIQLGNEAKRRSLELLELLRQNNIAVEQSLSKDKLGSQLALAEKMKIPITLIMGHKEALEGTVIVRHMVNRSQETISLTLLAHYLKAHH